MTAIETVLCVQVFGPGPMLRDRPGYQFGYVRDGERLGTSVKTDGLSVCVPLRRRLPRAAPCVSAETKGITRQASESAIRSGIAACASRCRSRPERLRRGAPWILGVRSSPRCSLQSWQG